jgi:WhiB family redox-sensing transcriptional regulator
MPYRKTFTITCEQCGNTKEAGKPTNRFCSNQCSATFSSKTPRRPKPANAWAETEAKVSLDKANSDWTVRANCSGGETDDFFPERGKLVTVIRDYCVECPVRLDCLKFALVTNQDFGIWGGHKERDINIFPRSSKRPLHDLSRICPSCRLPRIFFDKDAKLCDKCRGMTIRQRSLRGHAVV